MELTLIEKKFVEKLRTQNRFWMAWARWFVIATGILSALLFAFWGYVIHNLTLVGGHQVMADDLLAFALVWTKCILFGCFSMWCVCTAITKWHGDMKETLLLKLLDAQQKQSATNEARP